MNEKLSITLPSELISVLQEQVDSGRFGSVSDAVRDALERHDWHGVSFEPDMEFMRLRIKQSLEDPRPSISIDEMRARLKLRLAELYGR